MSETKTLPATREHGTDLVPGLTGPDAMTPWALEALHKTGICIAKYTGKLPPAYVLVDQRSRLTPYDDLPLADALLAILAHADRMAQQGMAPYQIAERLGIPMLALKEALVFLPSFAAAVKGGLAGGIDEASRVLRKSIEDGDTRSAKFLLETRGGYIIPRNNSPAVVVNIGDDKASVTRDSVDSLQSQQSNLLTDIDYSALE